MPAFLKAKTVLNSFVPISRFNKGEAKKIISEVQDDGVKFIISDNAPECVMLSIDQYKNLLEEIEDLELAATALEREYRNTEKKYIPFDQVLAEAGITQADLDSVDETEIEFE